MKLLMRYFFRTVRLLMGPVMLVWERITLPRGTVRDAADQSRIDGLTRNLALYQYKTCPFCIKVRRTIARLSLNIEYRDAQHDQQHRDDLARMGGQLKVPCLRIETPDGQAQWLYESNAINAYLQKIAL